MKSFAAIVFSILLTLSAIAIIAFNIKHLTIPLLVAAGSCMTLAMALAIPANLEKALIIIVPYLPDALVGGRRKTDPPKPDGQ